MREMVQHIEEVTGHRFRDLALLLEAFTHASYAHEHPEANDNEVLEFVGTGGRPGRHALARRGPRGARGRATAYGSSS